MIQKIKGVEELNFHQNFLWMYQLPCDFEFSCELVIQTYLSFINDHDLYPNIYLFNKK